MAQPYFEVFVTTPYIDKQGAKKSSWDKVGAAFPAKSGDGGMSLRINRVFTIVPGVNEMVIRPPLPPKGQSATDFPPAPEQVMDAGYPADDGS